MKIESTKGNVDVGNIEAAAQWIGEQQPAYVSVNGVDIDYESDDEDDAIAVKIARALESF